MYGHALVDNLTSDPNIFASFSHTPKFVWFIISSTAKSFINFAKFLQILYQYMSTNL